MSIFFYPLERERKNKLQSPPFFYKWALRLFNKEAKILSDLAINYKSGSSYNPAIRIKSDKLRPMPHALALDKKRHTCVCLFA